MSLRINTNTAATAVMNGLEKINRNEQKAMERIATGTRIVSAADDAAGLSQAENLRSQIRGLAQAERNASDGISIAQISEGALSEVGGMMIRLRELAIQASSDAVGARERAYITEEVQNITSEISRIANATNFNGIDLLNGQSAKPFYDFQVGNRNTEVDRIRFNTSENSVTSEALGIQGIDFSTSESAQAALDVVDSGMEKVFGVRARIGATQNKLQSTINNIRVARQNFEEAHSRIADTDLAVEASEMVKNNILQSANLSLLVQANNNHSLALKLL